MDKTMTNGNHPMRQLRNRGNTVAIPFKGASPQQIGRMMCGIKNKRRHSPGNGFVITEVDEVPAKMKKKIPPSKGKNKNGSKTNPDIPEDLNKQPNEPQTDKDTPAELRFPQESNDAVEFRQIDERAFEVRLRQNQQLHFHGRVQATLLEGRASVLGWYLTPGTPVFVFSSRGSSLVGFKVQADTVLRLQRFDSHLDACLRQLCTSVGLFGGSKDRPGEKKPPATARILAERCLDCRFLNDHSSEKVLVLEKSWKNLIRKLLLDATLPRFQGSFTVIMAGGKDVGKSTFLRILANRLMSEQPEDERGVFVLDCDPGQSEFTPPGCVSLVKVTEPLLGPSFATQKRPVRSYYLGQIDVKRCLTEYNKAVQLLMSAHAELGEGKPLLVNTMGFNSDIGVDIMVGIVRLCMQNFLATVVNIQSSSLERNYPEGTFRLGNNCRVLNLPSFSGKTSSSESHQRGMPPSKLREISLLSYLSPLLKAPTFSVLHTPPYVIRLGHLVLGVIHEYVHPNLILKALLGSLVALCRIDKDDPHILSPKDDNLLISPKVVTKPVPTLPCFGYGIVCGIDLAAGQLFLQTPEAEEQLRDVNCLLMGAVQLPLVVRTTGVQGSVPFVCQESGLTTSAPVKRGFRPIASLFDKRAAP